MRWILSSLCNTRSNVFPARKRKHSFFWRRSTHSRDALKGSRWWLSLADGFPPLTVQNCDSLSGNFRERKMCNTFFLPSLKNLYLQNVFFFLCASHLFFVGNRKFMLIYWIKIVEKTEIVNKDENIIGEMANSRTGAGNNTRWAWHIW